MFDKQGRYVIQNYQGKPPFSSFLPGIAGPLGVPVWCYYNNRGQCVCSFGAQDKEHAVMEFSPARQAYRDVARTGFRTFCRVNGTYRELFTQSCDMHIGMGELEITCEQDGLCASAAYFGVPGERTAALARVLTVANTGAEPITLELLDGMPELVPYGVSHENLKEMNNLAQAWMRVEDGSQGMACFRVRASMEDTAQVSRVEGCNFCLAWDEGGDAAAAPGAAGAGVRGGHVAGRGGGLCPRPAGTAAGRAPADGKPLPLLLFAQRGGAGAGGGPLRVLSLRPGIGQGPGGRPGRAYFRRGLVRGEAPPGRAARGGAVRPGLLPHSRPGV